VWGCEGSPQVQPHSNVQRCSLSVVQGRCQTWSHGEGLNQNAGQFMEFTLVLGPYIVGPFELQAEVLVWIHGLHKINAHAKGQAQPILRFKQNPKRNRQRIFRIGDPSLVPSASALGLFKGQHHFGCPEAVLGLSSQFRGGGVNGVKDLHLPIEAQDLELLTQLGLKLFGSM
jgi:hypothetical protein